MTTTEPNTAEADATASEPTTPDEKVAAKAPVPTMVTLDALCREMKVNPRDARMMLRLAAKQKGQYPNLGKEHVARQPWAWTPGSKALAEAKKAIAATPAA